MKVLTKNMGKVFLALTVAALAFCLAGCSSEPKQEEKPLETTVGFSQDDMGLMEVGIIIKNPNESLQFDNAALTVSVKDADGKVIASDDEFMVGDVLPNEEFAVALTFSPGDRKAETVDVQINSEAPTKSDAVSGITIDENSVSTKYDYDPSYSNTALATTNGEYTNETELSYDAILITTLLFDKDGNIVGAGMDDQWDALKGTRPFQTYSHFNGDPSGVDSVKNYSHVYTMNHSNF